MFGDDFKAAVRGFNYTCVSGQWWLWAVLFAVAQVALVVFAQNTVAFVVYLAMFGSFAEFATMDEAVVTQLSKAFIVGMFPSACIAAVFVWWSAGWANPTRERGMALQRLNLGVGGWVVTVAGALLALYLINMLTFAILGIDPKTYMPTSGGVNDVNSSAGMVEKIMADLADEPWLFALTLPGIVFAGPLLEELIFRGALFSALRTTRLGSVGTVVLTAAAWAVVHGSAAPWLFVFLIFMMGLLLGWLLLRFGSLWVTIVVHAAWNGFSSLAIFGGVFGT